ncbi:hypothetical protein M514_08997 [Trichuris suis]|uniref:Uncharacterized protein n=1 Tax=Trichuris suis TaxID=68888 RepID=A0A085NKP2_9BILA|nr:hypothetical protein M514_08997 [Trichuris suis]
MLPSHVILSEAAFDASNIATRLAGGGYPKRTDHKNAGRHKSQMNQKALDDLDIDVHDHPPY